MTIPEALILAVLQGLTEFLPISSSAHLALAQALFGLKNSTSNILMIVVLHAASFLALLVYYWRDVLNLLSPRRPELIQLILASIPLAIVGFTLKDSIEKIVNQPFMIAGLLIVNGVFLILADIFSRERWELRRAPLGALLLIGLAQGIRLPGLSRSGTTIGTAWLCGMKRSDGVRFSFLLGMIAIAGVIAAKGKDLLKHQADLDFLPIVIAVVVTFVLSLGSIRLVEKLSRRRRFGAFGLYCILAGIGGLVYFSG